MPSCPCSSQRRVYDNLRRAQGHRALWNHYGAVGSNGFVARASTRNDFEHNGEGECK